MDTKTLEKICPWARNRLMEAVDLRCRRYGLTDDARAANPADSDVVGGTVLASAEKSQRAALYVRIEERGYDRFVDDTASTWFNRFMAIRYMELRDYLPNRVRMLSCATDGSFRPDCLLIASELELPGLDKARVFDLMDAADDEGLFRLILLAQCNELADALPEVFAHLGAADELMLPDGLLRTGENDVLYHLVADIPEETWQDVEVLGWMYQFYNSERKDDFFKSKRKASADDLAPATQLFTPKWIVQYLVENSLGRLWMLNNPNSHLKDQMKYFIAPDDEHEDFIRINGPEDITFCDPACGSGHILSYAFELLYAMYEERGYRPSEIPELILEKNLTGFEIDERAAQISSLVLAMRAREHDRRFLKRDVTARIHVFQSVDCEGAGLSKSVSEQLEHLGEIGSLVKLTENDLDSIHALTQEAGTSLLDSKLAESLRSIEPALRAISDHYDVVVANPPYMGSSSFNPFMSNWIKKNYPDVKSDLCTCFIERGFALARINAYAGMVTSQSWMFLSSYTSFREKIINEHSVVTLADTKSAGYHSDNFTANSAFVIFNSQVPDAVCRCFRLDQSAELKSDALLEAISNSACGWCYCIAPSAFHHIPGSPIAYWASAAVRDSFKTDYRFGDVGSPRIGIKTGNNVRFIRDWWEVDEETTSTQCANIDEAISSGKKWFAYSKGGSFRRWYGNSENVILWQDGGKVLANIAASLGVSYSSLPRELQFKESVLCNLITSDILSFRLKPSGVLPDIATVNFYPTGNPNVLLGVSNSSVYQRVLSILCPTINNTPGDLAKLPWSAQLDRRDVRDEVSRLVESNILLSMEDWNAAETSWDFCHSGLI